MNNNNSTTPKVDFSLLHSKQYENISSSYSYISKNNIFELSAMEYWSQQQRRQEIRKKKSIHKFIKSFEDRIGFTEAKKLNPRLKLVVGIGSMICSSIAKSTTKRNKFFCSSFLDKRTNETI